MFDEPPSPAVDVEALYREHAAALYAWASLRLGPRLLRLVSPTDLAQEVWLRAARAAGSYEAEHGPPRAWLFTIAKHVLYELHRAAQRRSRELAADGATARLLALDAVPVEVTSLTQRLARDDAIASFLQRVGALDEDDRQLLLHVGLECMSHDEAAARLGVSHAALTKRWQRLRGRIRDWPAARHVVGVSGSGDP